MVALTLTQCKTTSKTVTPASAIVPPAATTAPAPATDMLAVGKTVFYTKCSGCHDQPREADHGTAEWQEIMVRMSRKAHLSDDETKSVLAYLGTTSKK